MRTSDIIKVMSNVSEQIRPETLASIRVFAQNSGLSVDEYVRRLLPPREQDMALKPDVRDDDIESDLIEFAEGTEHLSVYEGPYSREDIYFDHD